MPTKTIPTRTVAAWSLALLAFTLNTTHIAAEDEEWQPAAPMPTSFDWIQMASLEWLKGELISMYDDSLEFDSDEFDMQTVDWGDVKEIRTKGTMQVAFEDGTIAIATVVHAARSARNPETTSLSRRASPLLLARPASARASIRSSPSPSRSAIATDDGHCPT